MAANPLSHKGKFLACPQRFMLCIFPCQIGVETAKARERSCPTVFTLEWRSMFSWWVSLRRVQHPLLGTTAPSNVPNMGAWKEGEWKQRVEGKTDVQSTYITNEAQRNTILRQHAALRCRLARNTTNHRPYLAISYSVPCVGLFREGGSDQEKVSSYSMQSIDCAVIAYLIQLISNGRSEVGYSADTTQSIYRNQIAGYPAAQVIEERAPAEALLMNHAIKRRKQYPNHLEPHT